jgi:hypothetical protein
MTTVLLVPGAFSFGNTSSVEPSFGGPQSLLTQLGDGTQAAVVPVMYNDWDVINGSTDGAAKIDAALHEADPSQNIVLLGHSYGAVSSCVWLRTYGLTSTISPSRLTIVHIGNSIRPNNGLAAICSLYLPVGPVTTKYTVYDCVREWDKWADWPNASSSAYYWQAINNVNTGDMYPDSIHNTYGGVRLTDPHVSITIGTVTFMLFQTDPLPYSGGATFAQIETAYNRLVMPNWSS